MPKLPHLRFATFSVERVAVSTSDQHFVITMDDGETFWEIRGQVIDGVLVITKNVEEPV